MDTTEPMKRQSPWHPTLEIQVPWTAKREEGGLSYRILCPGNVTPWIMAAVNGGDREQTAAYARLIKNAPRMYDALRAVYEDKHDAHVLVEEALQAASEGDVES